MCGFDIEKLTDPEGLTWTRQFSIYDESDALNLIKEIIIQDMQLDPKRLEPKKVRWAISNAKNQGYLTEQLEQESEGSRGKLIAQIYILYRKALAANNAIKVLHTEATKPTLTLFFNALCSRVE